MARILFFDIETAGVNALKSDLGFTVCVGMKWSDEPQAFCLTARKRDLRHFDDRWLLQKASQIFSRADLIVAHYGSVFDRRFFQGRLAINGLPPVPATKMRDTCMIARSAFNFSSNRLGHLAEILGLRARKYHKRAGTEWPGWWMRTMQGDMTALNAMADYCIKDVLALEALYYRIRPFDNAHPRIFAGRDVCGVCGARVEYRGFAYVGQAKYRRFVCTVCRRWDRSRTAHKECA